ncbi:MAG: class 1 fructose-bisphosphatase [Sphingobacteriales bacterium]|nr:class 1 fructose-bisphosphatase [Sphingobacteriales bacterium]
MNQRIITLDEFIIQRQQDFPFASGDLSALLRDIGLAAKIINREVNKAGLVDILGVHGTQNIFGEEVKKLDVLANDTLIAALRNSGHCSGVASEELDDFIYFTDSHSDDAEYVVCMDPLDGSSNIDVNTAIGTIFSIYRRLTRSRNCVLEDFLQKGVYQVAGGYIIYGSSTMMVYSTGSGVNGFTLDPSIGEFCLSHPNIRIPSRGNIYSLNQGYESKFEQGLKNYIAYCQSSDKATDKKPYSGRYIGSMVADVHRNLIKGGIFIYPAMSDSPKGKLRLLYECNPMAFIVEQAGGKATDGKNRILTMSPQSLHQTTPVFIGSREMVEDAERYLQEFSS